MEPLGEAEPEQAGVQGGGEPAPDATREAADVLLEAAGLLLESTNAEYLVAKAELAAAVQAMNTAEHRVNMLAVCRGELRRAVNVARALHGWDVLAWSEEGEVVSGG